MDTRKKTCASIVGPVKCTSISQAPSPRSMGVRSVRTACPRDCKDAVVVGSPCARHDATVKTSCRRRTDWLRRPAPRDAGSASMPRRAGCVARCCVPVRHLLASSMWLLRASGNPGMTSAQHSLPSRMGTTSVLMRNPPAATSALETSIVRPLVSTSCVDKDREQGLLQQKTSDKNELRTAVAYSGEARLETLLCNQSSSASTSGCVHPASSVPVDTPTRSSATRNDRPTAPGGKLNDGSRGGVRRRGGSNGPVRTL